MAEPTYRHIQPEIIDGILVLRLTEIQLQGDNLADALREEFLAIAGQTGGRKIVVDFTSVEYVFSTAFRPFLSLRRRIQETGGQMVFCNLAPSVVEVFRIVRLISPDGVSTAPFEVQPNVPAAVAHLNGLVHPLESLG